MEELTMRSLWPWWEKAIQSWSPTEGANKLQVLLSNGLIVCETPTPFSPFFFFFFPFCTVVEIPFIASINGPWIAQQSLPCEILGGLPCMAFAQRNRLQWHRMWEDCSPLLVARMFLRPCVWMHMDAEMVPLYIYGSGFVIGLMLMPAWFPLLVYQSKNEIYFNNNEFSIEI